MRILPVSYNNLQPRKMPAFRSMSCDYRLPDNSEMGLYTWFFRYDLPWDDLSKFELENFKSANKVNIIQFAPSDGSETYTKIMSLLDAGKSKNENVEKFFPIQAYDINPEIVKGANLGFINIRFEDFQQILSRDINPDTYFEDSMRFYSENKSFRAISEYDKFFTIPFKVTKELSKRAQFRVGDMFKLIDNIKDNSNTILMARNSLGYYDESIIKDFVDKASKALKPNSLFIVGMLEEDEAYLKSYLERSGFERIMRNVFRRL